MRIVVLLVMTAVLAVAVACGSDSDKTSPTSTAGAPAAAGSPVSGTEEPRSDVALRGEDVEKVANVGVRRVTWADGTVYEETLPTLILRTIGQPEASSGRRVVSNWLGDDRWQVIIYTRIQDPSTDPPALIDLLAEFLYDGPSDTFEPVNGRAAFALTGRDPCASDNPPADLCPLDKEVGVQ